MKLRIALGFSGDAVLLFCARCIRMFAFGSTGVILALYLREVGLSDQQMGLLLYMTLVGDALISLVVTVCADDFGRRKTMLLGCLLKLLGAIILAYVHGPQFWLLAFGATVGVISPSGNEVGPFMALEQSVLAEQVSPAIRTVTFAWYNFLGSCCSACGALATGLVAPRLALQYSITELDSYRLVFVQYGGAAVTIMFIVLLLSEEVERKVHSGFDDDVCSALEEQPLRSFDVATESDPLLTSRLLDDKDLREEVDTEDQNEACLSALYRPMLPVQPCHLRGSADKPASEDATSLPPHIMTTRGRGGTHQEDDRSLKMLRVLPEEGPALNAAVQIGSASSDVESGGHDLILGCSEPQKTHSAQELKTCSVSTEACGTYLENKSVLTVDNCSDVPIRAARDEKMLSVEKTLEANDTIRNYSESREDCLQTPFLTLPADASASIAEQQAWSHSVDLNSHGIHVSDSLLSKPSSYTQAVSPKFYNLQHGGIGSSNGYRRGSKLSAASSRRRWLGLSASSLRTVTHLSLLFATDSFASSMITGTLLAYYFQVTFDLSTTQLGGILFGANIIGGLSSLASGWVANRFGLVNTMVFTHMPSNIFLILVPFMPSVELAVTMVFLRFSISQMDVVPRQSYVSGIVRPEERTATLGITNIVRSLGAAFGPLATGFLAAGNKFGWAFFVSGGVQIFYDIMLLISFRHMKAEHEGQ
ncbi:hypothetical protein CEUSTIGMA_g6055.t1 [Chlamydomonas eustigma]|uniref:Major facilitator superfamily (MFS) profile domain-containing protein n=1 Tax=Chlamydomonas eustigma TaxID=1157962 RepID=A0A250X6E7_9CHLO|nr:hypothetical protein CEUSTIGMA_g6055.t1 [Chlamydomonas eustigma]|eukprot:GAX78616.1 hypothetical protein CEUSTIGMA_g6055.t1 [Chlamydomonas eustigma]